MFPVSSSLHKRRASLVASKFRVFLVLVFFIEALGRTVAIEGISLDDDMLSYLYVL